MRPKPSKLTLARELIANTEKYPERTGDLEEGLSLIVELLDEHKDADHGRTAFNIYRTYKQKFINDAKAVLSQESDVNKWREYCDILQELEQISIDDKDELLELRKIKKDLLLKWSKHQLSILVKSQKSHVDMDQNLELLMSYMASRIPSKTSDR